MSSMPRILVVDDEPINLEIVSEYFDGSGYAPILVESGEEAWELLQAEDAPFELVLLDRMMPGMDGMELLHRIKSHPHLRSMPVVMQTAASAPEQVREGLTAGAYYYLIKPYEQESLLSIVRAALDDGRERSNLQQRLQEHRRALQCMNQGEFFVATVEEATHVAALIAQAYPDPEKAALGISELLVNAVEHGNLGITYSEKAQLKLSDNWHAEVARRLSLPENISKRARVSFLRDASQIALRVQDQGKGFDWQKYLELDPARAFDPNGRGIALARMLSFDTIEYQGCGNVVYTTLSLPAASTGQPA